MASMSGTGTPRHLTLLFCASAGKQGEDLGSDECQLVLIVYLIYDVLNNKVVAVQQNYVRPGSSQDYCDNVLTEECKQVTGLDEEVIKNSQPLEQVLDEMERFFKAKGIHPEVGGNMFTFCTDGPQHLRLCIHSEAMQKSLSLQPYCYQYFDLRKEFQKLYKKPVSSITEMLEYLSVEEDHSIDYGVRRIHEMANIIKRLLNDGHQFSEPERINDRLQPGICNKSDYVDDDTVIRARGLPWQSSDSDIAKFFTGLNIAKGGVALCLSQQGRRNGEALIRFDSKESRDMALKKHKHHLGNRYIEVYKACGRDFLNVAGGSNTEAQAFLSQGAQCIIRMRGLPYTASAEQVLMFFNQGDRPVDVLNGKDGIMFVHQPDGRATGDAFVLFASDEDAGLALSKHRELIGSRYIELFKSTTAEVQQVLNRTTEARARHTPPVDQFSISPLGLPPINSPLMSFLPGPNPNLLAPAAAAVALNSHPIRDCVRLRGLPFEANVTDILGFLGEHARNIVYQGVHMVYNSAGTPSGEAFIQMDSEIAAMSAAENRHKKFMLLANPISGNKKRYIEVFQCSSNDMNVILTNPELPAQQLSSPTISNYLPSTMNLTPPSAPPQLSPTHGSPNGAATVSIAAAQNPPVNFQPFLPRNLLVPAPGAPSPAMLAQLGALSQNSALTAATSAGLPQQQQILNQIAQQQFLLNQQAHVMRQPLASSLCGTPPILCYYPSPPVSPQAFYNSNNVAAAPPARSVEVVDQESW